MRIRIGGSILEVRGTANIVYDSQSDTIDILPALHSQRQATPLGRPKEQAPLLLTHEEVRPEKEVTKQSLTEMILKIAEEGGGPVSKLAFTWGCLGRNSSAKHKKYLDILLDELVIDGLLVGSTENGRKRYSLPQ